MLATLNLEKFNYANNRYANAFFDKIKDDPKKDLWSPRFIYDDSSKINRELMQTINLPLEDLVISLKYIE